MYKKIPVEIRANKAWSIFMGAGIVDKLAGFFDCEPYSSVILLNDAATNKLYGRKLADILKATGKKVLVFTVPRGERSKSLEEAERAYKFLLNNNVDRRALLCILGGGVIGDLGGYIAATYLRGIDYIQLPTTLLAQVDSSIGGKVGVNFSGKKNMVGCFYQPQAIISDVDFLKSLPQEEMRNGMAEVIKYGVAMDKGLFKKLSAGKGGKVTSSGLIDIVERCSQLKARVVEADETERSGQRAILNFGHTVGHAIEAVSGMAGRHGEAISVGMAAAARISERMGMLSRDSVLEIEGLLLRFGLPIHCPDTKPEKLISAIHFDKKVVRGEVRWVLLDRIGHGVVNCTVDDVVVREVLAEVCQ